VGSEMQALRYRAKWREDRTTKQRDLTQLHSHNNTPDHSGRTGMHYAQKTKKSKSQKGLCA